MPLLTKTYFAQNKGLAFLGTLLGLGATAVIHFFPLSACAVPISMGLLNFPYGAKTPDGRMLRLGLIGFSLSLLFVYGGRWVWPLSAVGLIGSAVFGAGVLCLRHRPPMAEPSETI